MKRALVFVFAAVLICGSLWVSAAEQVIIGGTDNDIWISKYGNVYTDCSGEMFFNGRNFDWGDTVRVSFLNQELVLPVVPTYNHVESGSAAIIVKKAEDGAPTGNVALAVNMGNFAESYGIAKKQSATDGTWSWTAAEGVSFPINVDFALEEKGGYMAGYLLGELSRSNAREDYPHLSDEEYANFRAITTTGLKEGVLFRSSNPVNPELGRNLFADAALEAAGVTVIMNLADSESAAAAYPDFADSYYGKQQVIYLGVGVDFESAEFKEGLARGLKFFAQNKGVYAVHCKEGKDRAGFVAAILECLTGASLDEVCEDYMLTYANYYGVEAGTEMYTAICQSNIVKSLEAAFDTEDLESADLATEARDYVKSIGLSDEETDALLENLCAAEEEQTPTVPPTGDGTASLYVLSLLSLALCVLINKNLRHAF